MAEHRLFPVTALSPAIAQGTAMRRWRTIFLSDLHIGSRFFRLADALTFLDRNEGETLVLNGDIVDLRVLARSGTHLPRHGASILRLIHAAHTANVVYVTGNHDRSMEIMVDREIAGIRFCRDYRHVTADGRTVLVVHGDCFDAELRHGMSARKIYWSARSYYTLLGLDDMIGLMTGDRRRRLMGRFKRGNPSWRGYVDRFRSLAADAARAAGADAVICGHIHVPEIRRHDGVLYLNSGDWIEHATALVEDFDGRLHLVDHAGRTLESDGEGAGPHGRVPMAAASA